MKPSQTVAKAMVFLVTDAASCLFIATEFEISRI